MRHLSPASYKLTRHAKITNAECKKEIARRGLTMAVGEYVQECKITSRKTGIVKTGLCLENDNGGFYIRVPDSKKYTTEKYLFGAPSITTFPADPRAEEVTCLAFADDMDFLTYIHMYGKRPQDDITVYYGLAEECGERILAKRPRHCYVAHHNTDQGRLDMVRIADVLETSGIVFGSLADAYEDHKDLSAWRQANPYVTAQAVPTMTRRNLPRPSLRL